MPIYNIDERLFKIFLTETSGDFLETLRVYFDGKDIRRFTVWKITGNVCEPYQYVDKGVRGTFDIFELGFSGKPMIKINKKVSYFDSSFFVSYSLFLSYKKRNIFAVTFHDKLSPQDVAELEQTAQYLGKCAYDLREAEKRMDIYVDYQKKVDFVKRAAVIFKALDLPSVISVSINFFMEVFSADAVCAVYKGGFQGIGVSVQDISNNIFMGEMSLEEYMFDNKATKFIENAAVSHKFNIKNVFFVYEETAGIQFALFNIITDVIPDKEFSSLVAGIVSIAAENASNHEQMMKFKLEESEVNTTVEILNSFVQKEISIPSAFDIYSVTYPARNAGGDFIDLRRIDGKIVFCLADVCGKGYSAAVFTVVLSAFAHYIQNFSSLKETLESLNDFLLAKNFENRFITLFAGSIDEKERTIRYISCGHDPAVILHKDSTVVLKSKYLPLGLEKEKYEETMEKIPEDSLIFAYTDGLIEYTDFNSLIKLVRSKSDKSAKALTEYLYKSLVTDRSLQRDDFTCIVIKDKTEVKGA